MLIKLFHSESTICIIFDLEAHRVSQLFGILLPLTESKTIVRLADWLKKAGIDVKVAKNTVHFF
jgi:hypothetical protein